MKVAQSPLADDDDIDKNNRVIKRPLNIHILYIKVVLGDSTYLQLYKPPKQLINTNTYRTHTTS